MLNGLASALTQKKSGASTKKGTHKFLKKIKSSNPEFTGLVDSLKDLIKQLLQQKSVHMGDFKRKAGTLFHRLHHKGMEQI